MADDMGDPDSRRILLDIAPNCERLALWVERRLNGLSCGAGAPIAALALPTNAGTSAAVMCYESTKQKHAAWKLRRWARPIANLVADERAGAGQCGNARIGRQADHEMTIGLASGAERPPWVQSFIPSTTRNIGGCAPRSCA
jgi:hypothetical protein